MRPTAAARARTDDDVLRRRGGGAADRKDVRRAAVGRSAERGVSRGRRQGGRGDGEDAAGRGAPTPGGGVRRRGHVTFGRHPSCDVVVEHPSTSRLHCVIQFRGGGRRRTCSIAGARLRGVCE